MKLTVTTPLSIVVQAEGVLQIRAEDDSGAFGILPGHAQFLTALAVSVLSWRDAAGQERFVAVRGGMLAVQQGEDSVVVASPEAVQGDDLHRLESEVLTRFRRELEQERMARTDAQRLHLAAIRQIVRLLRPGHPPRAPGGPLPSGPATGPGRGT